MSSEPPSRAPTPRSATTQPMDVDPAPPGPRTQKSSNKRPLSPTSSSPPQTKRHRRQPPPLPLSNISSSAAPVVSPITVYHQTLPSSSPTIRSRSLSSPQLVTQQRLSTPFSSLPEPGSQSDSDSHSDSDSDYAPNSAPVRPFSSSLYFLPPLTFIFPQVLSSQDLSSDQTGVVVLDTVYIHVTSPYPIG